jgi:hypothetical protein
MRRGRKVPKRAFASAVLAALLLCGGCGALREQVPGRLVVRAASVVPAGDRGVLDLRLDCELSGPMRDALDHGIPLVLRVRVAAAAPGRVRVATTGRIDLRYFPLSRRYQLRGSGNGSERSFTAPAALIDALGAVRIGLPAGFAQLPPGTRYALTIDLDHAALPGTLHLPVLFEPAWWLAATFRWTA